MNFFNRIMGKFFFLSAGRGSYMSRTYTSLLPVFDPNSYAVIALYRVCIYRERVMNIIHKILKFFSLNFNFYVENIFKFLDRRKDSKKLYLVFIAFYSRPTFKILR